MGTQRSVSERGVQKGARFEATNGKAGEVRVQVQQRSAQSEAIKGEQLCQLCESKQAKSQY